MNIFLDMEPLNEGFIDFLKKGTEEIIKKVNQAMDINLLQLHLTFFKIHLIK